MDKIKLPQIFTWEEIIKTMKTKPRHLAFTAVTGYQLYNWYESRKYCGRCGTLLFKNEKIRSLACPSCRQVEYPKIAPSVIIGVTNGNRLLLAEYPNYDKYALLAGFVEIGETLEETVKREVMEEVGLKVKDIRYYKSQPWSLSDNLLVGFFCEVDSSDKIIFDTDAELSNAMWFEKEDIPLADDYVDGSLTFEMIDHFKRGKIKRGKI